MLILLQSTWSFFDINFYRLPFKISEGLPSRGLKKEKITEY